MAWPASAGRKIEPGQVLNPGGRPKGMSIEKQARLYLDRPRGELEEIAKSLDRPARECIAAKWALDCLDGKEKARESLVARESGAIPQSTKLEITKLTDQQVLDAMALEQSRLEQGE